MRILLFVLFVLCAALPVRVHAEINMHLLRAVNDMWNHRIRYEREPISNPQTGAVRDLWQTPEETLRRGRGDCEDYAIAKMFTLREARAGLDATKLFLGYTTDPLSGTPHIILLVARSDGDYFVLDNLHETVLLLSRSEYKIFCRISATGKVDVTCPRKTLTLLHRGFKAMLTRRQKQ